MPNMEREPTCHRCTRAIASKVVSCDECGRSFHPGCVKSYLAFSTAGDCCKRHFRSPHLPVELVTLSIPASGGADVSAGGACRSSNLTISDSTLATNQIYPPVTVCNPPGTVSNFDTVLASIEKLRIQVAESEARIEARAETRFAAFADKHQLNMNNIIEKLSSLSVIAEAVAQFGQRIDSLERENISLRREIDNLRATKSSAKHEIVISGLPVSLALSPTEMTKNAFRAINASELVSHILDVRTSGRPASDSSDAPIQSACSHFISLSSESVCRAVIARKRAKGILRQNEILPAGTDRQVYVNEVLPKATFDLLQRAKRVAKEKRYKYVWHRDGQICIRRADGDPMVFIESEADLVKLN